MRQQDDAAPGGAEAGRARAGAHPARQAADPLDPAAALAGSVAHDLGNLLTVVLGNAELLVEELEGRPALAELAALILSAAQRGTELTGRLDRFARRIPPAVAPLPAAVLLADFGRRLAPRLPPSVHLEMDVPDGLWRAALHPAALSLALEELTANALAALGGRGRLRIAAANHPAAAGEPPRLRIRVQDDGPGMDPATLHRCRQPGFAAGVAGHRTALGLALAMRVAAAGGGRLTIESTPGEGTCATLEVAAATS